jgi:hypothetical protein
MRVTAGETTLKYYQQVMDGLVVTSLKDWDEALRVAVQ